MYIPDGSLRTFIWVHERSIDNTMNTRNIYIRLGVRNDNLLILCGLF